MSNAALYSSTVNSVFIKVTSSRVKASEQCSVSPFVALMLKYAASKVKTSVVYQQITNL
jgi:hypothetical protein